MIGRAGKSLQSLGGGSELAHRFRACVQPVQKRVAFDRPRTPAPIHGALGWDCIHYGVEGRFYLYRFESCRRSDPGLDLGGFAADLLCFTRAHHEEGVFRMCRDVLLSAYNLQAERSMSVNDLRFYIAFALIERLQRAQPRAAVEAGEWLAALEATIWGWETPAEVEVSA
jgi:hypothetical protein